MLYWNHTLIYDSKNWTPIISMAWPRISLYFKHCQVYVACIVVLVLCFYFCMYIWKYTKYMHLCAHYYSVFLLTLTVKHNRKGWHTAFSYSSLCINASHSEGVLCSLSEIKHCHCGCVGGCVIHLRHISFDDVGEGDGITSNTERISRRNPWQGCWSERAGRDLRLLWCTKRIYNENIP